MNPQGEFQALSMHLAALLDHDAVTVAEASGIAAKFIQAQLGCSRVTIWLLDRTRGQRAMRRFAGFDAADGQRFTQPLRLEESACGAYLDTLLAEGTCVIEDCLADARLAPMRDSYLLPNDIRASMDATIAFNGAVRALVCCTQHGATRRWSRQEVALLKRCAAEMALRRARRHARDAAATGVVTDLVRKLGSPR